ncbi:MAG: putative bifunctional diguanylate cyclase/phosphodiesterase [Propylenella sp.]
MSAEKLHARGVPPRGGSDAIADGARAGKPVWSDWQHDRLLGLQRELSATAQLGRQELLDALNAAIREATASGRPAAAVLVDLNNFLGINIAWGPSVGDEVLAETAARIADFVGGKLCGGASAAVHAGRLDADHFLAVVPKVESFGALLSSVAELVGVLAQPLSLSGRTIAVGARAAIVQIPAHGRSVTSVLGRGFRLINSTARAKADGVAMSETEAGQVPSTVMLERDLTAALSTDQLFIALQPKVETATGLVRGAEALARWQHPELGALAPPVFVETAERSGLIFDLGLRILRDVCRASHDLAEKGKTLPLAVNVSPHQLAHPDFLGRFLEVVDREGVDPQTLEIEVTETAAMMGGERMLEGLRALRRCGIGVAIDDFGTGFSNLAALSALPADTLKIDRSLVTGSDQGGKAEALLNIAVQLGCTFGLSTVAEGVETNRQLRHVTELGCDFVQGYLTGRPVRVAEFAERYLRAR